MPSNDWRRTDFILSDPDRSSKLKGAGIPLPQGSSTAEWLRSLPASQRELAVKTLGLAGKIYTADNPEKEFGIRKDGTPVQLPVDASAAQSASDMPSWVNPKDPESVNAWLLQKNAETERANNVAIDKAMFGVDEENPYGNAPTGGALGDLRAARFQTEQADIDTVKELKEALSQIKPVDVHEYGGDIASAQEDLARAQSAYGAEGDIYEKLKALSDPTVTAKERALEMQARVQEEQSRKAAVDAALQNLEQRGIKSGGAQIGALLGAQQTTSQNRMLQDLGTNAGAVDRAMSALKGAGEAAQGMSTTAGNIRSANDKISEFNALQKEGYGEWADKVALENATQATERAKTTAAAESGATNNKFARSAAETNAIEQALGLKTGTALSGAGLTQSAIGANVGYDVAKKAQEDLEPTGFAALFKKFGL